MQMPLSFRSLVAVAAFAPLLISATVVLVGELREQPSAEYVVAKHLEGTWERDEALNDRLGARRRVERISIRKDPSVLATIPAPLAKHYEELRVFQAGTVTLTSASKVESYPYMLISLEGNSYLALLRSTKGGELDDGEAALVTIASGAKREQDLLFMGGDFDNEPFHAFRRVEPAK